MSWIHEQSLEAHYDLATEQIARRVEAYPKLIELLTRAADALEEDHEVIKDFFSKSSVRDKFLPLIAELRKAAE